MPAKYTYLIKTDYLESKWVDKEFEARGNWKHYEGDDQGPDFFYIDGLHIADEDLFHIKSGLKNLVGDGKKAIVDKANLYTTLDREPGATQYLPRTYHFSIAARDDRVLDEFKDYFVRGQPMICKVANQGEGMNIITTDKFTEFHEFMMKQIAEQRKNPKRAMTEWVLQEYIANPLLLNRRKFHIRMLMLYQPGGKPCYYMYNSRIALAEKPYIRADWTDKDIHDTHFHRQAGLNWPQDANLPADKVAHIYKQIDTLCSYIVSSFDSGCYHESKNCFEVFGLDLMVTNLMEVKLIEVNDRIGLSATPTFKHQLFQGILAYMVDPLYPPDKKQVPPAGFVKIKRLGKKRSSSEKTKKNKQAKSRGTKRR